MMDGQINDNAAKEDRSKPESSSEMLAKRRMFYDNTLEKQTKNSKRFKVLSFSNTGKYVKEGERMRKAQIIKQLEDQEIERCRNNQSAYGPSKLEAHAEQPIFIKNSALVLNQKQVDEIPSVEWWDEFLLPEGVKEFPKGQINDKDLFMERITHYVQHPVPLKNEKLENLNKMVTPVYLTDREKKKLNRNKRLEKE